MVPKGRFGTIYNNLPKLLNTDGRLVQTVGTECRQNRCPMTAHSNVYPQSGPGTKSSSYLLLRGSTWYFRYALPSYMQRLLGGTKELKIALGTGALREAKLKAGRLAANAHEVCRVMGQQPGLLSVPVASLRAMLRDAILQRNAMENNPALGNCDQPCPLSAELLPMIPIDTSGNLHPLATACGPRLHSVLNAYCTEKQRVGAWTKRTVQDFIPKLQFFVEQLDDIPVNHIRRDHIREFKVIVDKLPARYGISKEFREHTLNDILNDSVPLEKRMTPSSLGKYYGVINSFLLWMHKNYDEVQSGLEKILSIRIAEQADLLRNIFDDNDLRCIFASESYRRDSFAQPYRYWMPIIAYYTGMRIEEICQLRIGDIICADGVHCFDVNGNNGNSVKTQAGWRKIPMHEILVVQLKFLDFVAKQKHEGHVRLFPELQVRSGRYSHYPSRWFNGDYLVKVGVKNEKSTGKVFHSFRHTFANACKLSGVDEFMAREILGHEVSSKSTTYGRYGKKYPVSLLYEDVMKKIHLVDISKYIMAGC